MLGLKQGLSLAVISLVSNLKSIATNASEWLILDVLDEDWQYFRINPQCNARFVPAGADVYELVISVILFTRLVAAVLSMSFFQKSATQELPIVNTTLDGEDAYATNDLLVRHPTKDGYWKVLGRADDQITMSNGLKVFLPQYYY